jgi:hypothetical protein
MAPLFVILEMYSFNMHSLTDRSSISLRSFLRSALLYKTSDFLLLSQSKYNHRSNRVFLCRLYNLTYYFKSWDFDWLCCLELGG